MEASVQWDFPAAPTLRPRAVTVRLATNDFQLQIAESLQLCSTPRVGALTLLLPGIPPQKKREHPSHQIGALAGVLLAKADLPQLRSLLVRGESTGSTGAGDYLPRLPTPVEMIFSRGLHLLELDRVHLNLASVSTLLAASNIERIVLGYVTTEQIPTRGKENGFGDALRRLSFHVDTCHKLVAYLMSSLRHGSGIAVEYSLLDPSRSSPANEKNFLDRGWPALFRRKLQGVDSLTLRCITFSGPCLLWDHIALSPIRELCLDGVFFLGGSKELARYVAKESATKCLHMKDCLNELNDAELDAFFTSLGGGGVRWLSLSGIRTTVAAQFAVHLPDSNLEIAHLEVESWNREEQQMVRRAILTAARNNTKLGRFGCQERQQIARRLGVWGLTVTTSNLCCAEVGGAILNDDDANLLRDYAFRNCALQPTE